MYSSRTKKVTTYGKRQCRYVSANSDFILRDLSEKSENKVVPQEQKLRLIGDMYDPQEHKPYSIRTSTQFKGKKLSSPKTPKSPQEKKSGKRKPLGTYQSNVPNSPAVPPKRVGKPRLPSGRMTPSSLLAFSPFTDVEIITLDDQGEMVTEQRRVSKPQVSNSSVLESNFSRTETQLHKSKKITPFTRPRSPEVISLSNTSSINTNFKRSHTPITISSGVESDVEEILPQFQEGDLLFRSRGKKATRAIVLSDSESEQEGDANVFLSDQPVVTSTRLSDGSQDFETTLGKNVLRDFSRTTKVDPGRTGDSSKIERRTNNVGSSEVFAWPKDSSLLYNKSPHYTYVHTARYPIDAFRNNVSPFPKEPTLMDDFSLDMDPDEELEKQLASLNLFGDLDNERTLKQTSLKDDLEPRSSPLRERESGRGNSQTPHSLRPLLSECGQTFACDFEEFIQSFPSDPLVSFSKEGKDGNQLSSMEKVGEASYSEVFGIGGVVLKIIPLNIEEEKQVFVDLRLQDTPPMSEPRDVLKEIIITRTLGSACRGFIKLLKSYVVRGRYPASLLSLWDLYQANRGSESIRPDEFSSSQYYAIIVLPNGGPDLETYAFKSLSPSKNVWRQACSIFWQVARSLSEAERLFQLEHRDLHWGQILVQHSGNPSSESTVEESLLHAVSMDDALHGLKATIIDLGLARIDRGPSEVYYGTFAAETFEGEGDYQYDVYRMMRIHNDDSWEDFRPLSNVMWLHYLADKVIRGKRLPTPTNPSGRTQKAARASRRDASGLINERRCYEALLEVERFLGDSVASTAKRAKASCFKKSRKLKQASSEPKACTQFTSANDVVQFGIQRGWIL